MPLRVWFKSRGTIMDKPMVSSIVLGDNALVDDLKAAIKKDWSPLFDDIPKAAFTVYFLNTSSDDYIPLHPDAVLGENPLPEILKFAPGTNSEGPVFFDFTTVKRL